MEHLLSQYVLRAAHRMAGMMPRRSPNGEIWTYPTTEEVLEAAGLYTVQTYIEVHRNTVLKFVAQRPIVELYLEAEQKIWTWRGARDAGGFPIGLQKKVEPGTM